MYGNIYMGTFLPYYLFYLTFFKKVKSLTIFPLFLVTFFSQYFLFSYILLPVTFNYFYLNFALKNILSFFSYFFVTHSK